MIHALGDDRPEIHPTAWIAPDAQVIGRVRIGAGASVWFGAVIRGDNEWIEIGDETNIQDGTVVHSDWGFPTRIGRGVTVGHRAIIHGCTIEAHALIGMGATVLNGARIGAECLVGAEALVTEGKSFDPRGLIVGAPAVWKRSLDDDAVAKLHVSAAAYAENARRFAEGLRPLA